MHRLLIVLFSLLLALPALAQDEEGADPESADDVATEVTEAADAADQGLDDEDDSDLTYDEEDEDVFIPSENVKFGQSIPFPTDI